MHPIFAQPGDAPTVPVTFVTAATWPEVRARLDARDRAYAEAAGFEPRPGQHLFLAGPKGELAGVLFGLDETGQVALRRAQTGPPRVHLLDPREIGAAPGVARILQPRHRRGRAHRGPHALPARSRR